MCNLRRKTIEGPLAAGKQYPTTVQFSTTTSPIYNGEVGVPSLPLGWPAGQ